MSRLWKLLRIHDKFQVIVRRPLPDVRNGLAAQIQPRKSFRLFSGKGYEGEVSESGFTVRRISTGGKGDSKPAIVVRGNCLAAGDSTQVEVTLRHGLLLVSFSWMLMVLAVIVACASLAGSGNSSANSNAWIGGAIMAAIAALWHLGLWRDMRKVKGEVIALLNHS